MKFSVQFIIAIIFSFQLSSTAISKIDETQIKKAEDFLESLANIGQFDLKFVFDRHISLFKATDDLNEQARQLEIILGYAAHIEDANQILHFAELQAEVGEKLNDPIIMAMARGNSAYSKSLSGETQTSFKEIVAHENEVIEYGNLKLRVHTATLRGLMANGLQRTLESIERLKTIDREIIDMPEYDWHRMLLYWTIAFNAIGNDDLDVAIEYYALSVELAKANDWAIDNSSIMFNIASLLTNAEAYSFAEKYIRKYGEISIAAQNHNDVFFMHYGLASLFLDQKKYEAVLEQIELAESFDNIQVSFIPLLYRAKTKSLIKLGQLDEAQIVFEGYKQFIEKNADYKGSPEEVGLKLIDSNILFADGNYKQAYEEYAKYHDQEVARLTKSHQIDAQGMREGLEAAIAQEEAEKKLAEAEVANQNIFLGAATLFMLLLTIFFMLQKKSAAALKISKAAADEANHAKSRFLANVSHELRTPLNAIIGFSDIMKNEHTGSLSADKYTEYSKLVNDAGKHLLSIINDILDLNKIESGKMELTEEAIDIAWLLDDVEHLLKQTAIKSQIELQFNLEEGLPDLYGDERQIKQILINLVNNSIKFSESNTSICTTASILDKGGMTIRIQDQGTGMTKVELEKAMKPFSQVKDTISRDKEGTGLGLPIAKAMTELHNGIMNITSVKGEGTLVELNFPADRVIPVRG